MQISYYVDHPKYSAISTYESSEPIPESWFSFWMIPSFIDIFPNIQVMTTKLMSL